MPEKLENARETLLKRGRTTLLRNGYSGLKVRDLTRQCAMASGTFYHYFQSKDELVFHLMELGWKHLFETIEPVMGSNRPLHDKLAIAYREFDTREQAYRAVFKGMPVVPDRFAGYYLENLAHMDRIFEDLLVDEEKTHALQFPLSPRKTAHIMTRFFISATGDKEIDFEDLWQLMKFE